MKLPYLKEFSRQINITVENISDYITIDLNSNFREILTVFRNLSFEDNFESFTFSGTIQSNSQLAIRNQFRGGIIPTKRLILRGDTYSPYIVDGVSSWDQNFVYLQNTHPTEPATVTVIFLK